MTSATSPPGSEGSPSAGSGSGLSSKGLSAGKIGAIGGAIIGISCIAPAYTLTSGLGPTISQVGVHTPAILLIGFVPMLLVVFGYRELNTAMPDSGTTFTWATRAFGPWLGWMGGWGLISATVLVLSNLAAVAVDFLFLLLAQIFGDPGIADLTRVLWINIPVTIILTAAAAWISYRGVEATQKIQVWLVAFQVLALGWFVIAAFVHVSNGTAFDPTPVELGWFNPAAAGDFSTVAAAVSLSIFLFWGWDTVITMNEEAKDPEKTPGRAAMLTIVAIVIIYLACTVAVISFAGVGTGGLGAGNPENQESIFAALAGPVMGPFAVLVSIAVLSSSVASLQSTMVSPSRTILAMGHYGALPKKYGNISPRYKSPSVATVTSAGAAIIFYVVMRLLSENALWDTITALGLMVCFYYGITGLACIWYFRRSLFTGVKSFFFRFLFPLVGGVTLLVIFVTTAIDSLDPDYGSGSSVFGIGLVFVLGIGVLLLGVIIMIIQSRRSPGYFRGETLTQGVHEG
ncbi:MULTISPECIES: APC family permease [Brevibacterium]|uniref:Amino acid/polyamine/organocation transporter, APC superfamily n=2 Tax=Brevibacterium antiquum TaxID=234835 RepID=A0A2H1HR78_9MICO|nr:MULTISPECIES: APC family permease [Brevibacterium]SMX65370.1 amino acid/polyamine/organocation transporter, APC superfamily [Brevibacterium antiquum CNRZ 918]SMX66081.1 amino acid/polyamine/organocation transporter, APC superfamily [Brevibacterium antiquum]HCG56758.1 APC family permease [Brevibacterium sp.]